MIALKELSLAYGGRRLFDRVEAVIEARDRIGLVGANGAGKTTLLRLLAGLEEPEGGSLQRPRDARVGYLPQEGVLCGRQTLFEEAASAFEDALDLRRKIDALDNEIHSMDTSSEAYAEALDRLGGWEQRLADLDEAKIPSRVESVLLGLGFAMEDMGRPVDAFSGGWQMRLALAKLLLAEPGLLLLDEPTNHLDIETQRWLESHLAGYRGALLVVSHDRAFLDLLCQRVFELSLGRLASYTGNYTNYERQSRERKEQRAKARLAQQRQIDKTQQFVDRFRYKASKARQVQSRLKALDKIERVEEEEEEHEIGFRFPQPPRGSQVVAELQGATKRYGAIQALRQVDLRIERGDRLAVVGPNGAGKSTLVKVLAGVEPIQAGERRLGPGTTLSYFAQHQAQELDPDIEVLETIERVRPAEGGLDARSLLGAFLFRGDDARKKVRVLSGGEKNRLALAKMLARPANFLVLDEPTNHLDMRSQEALRRSLAQYQGAFIVVSHNRAFLDAIVDRTVEVRAGRVQVHPGNVSDFVERLERRQAAAAASERATAAPSGAEEPVSPKERRRRRSQTKRDLEPLRREAEELERRIESMEADKRRLEAAMAEPDFYKDPESAKRGAAEYERLQPSLDEAYDRWERALGRLAKAEEGLA